MSLLESFAAKIISDHEIQIFYHLDGMDIASEPKVTLSAIASGPGIPDDQKTALRGRYAQTEVWKREPSTGVGQDFHHHIRDVVGGKREDLATRWTLSATAENLLKSASLYDRETGREVRVDKQMVLSLSDAAKMRLASRSIACAELVIACREITLTLFRTGHGFAATTLELARVDGEKVSALELLEAQILIGRFGKIRWAQVGGTVPVAGAPFRLGELVRLLVSGDQAVGAPERVTTYTYAQFAEPLPTPARDLFALHLARHYSSDYEIGPEIEGVSYVRDFETVRHAVALEGAATVVGATSEGARLPPFLDHFKTGTFHRHYVPVALLARHEHAFLVRRTSAAVLTQGEMQDGPKTVRRLQELREACLIFRLCYRFSELSSVTMHNSLHRAFRQVLHLDRMTDELETDITAVEAHLRELRESEEDRKEEQKHRRYYWVTVIGAGALAGLTMFSVTKEILSIFFPEVPPGTTEEFLRIFGRDLRESLIPKVAGLGLGVVTAIVGWIIAYLRGPKAGHSDHKTMHLMLEHMIEERAFGK